MLNKPHGVELFGDASSRSSILKFIFLYGTWMMVIFTQNSPPLALYPYSHEFNRHPHVLFNIIPPTNPRSADNIKVKPKYIKAYVAVRKWNIGWDLHLPGIAQRNIAGGFCCNVLEHKKWNFSGKMRMVYSWVTCVIYLVVLFVCYLLSHLHTYFFACLGNIQFMIQ